MERPDIDKIEAGIVDGDNSDQDLYDCINYIRKLEKALRLGMKHYSLCKFHASNPVADTRFEMALKDLGLMKTNG